MRAPGFAAWLPRIEDWVLTGWVAIVLPVLGRGQSPRGELLPSGRPLDGALDLLAIAGMAACLALRRSEPEPSRTGPAMSAAVGPLTGGLLLVAIAGVTALALPSWAGLGLLALGGAALLVARLRLPPTSVATRRTLMTPVVLATGTLFWRLVGAVTGSVPAGDGSGAGVDPGSMLPVIALFLAASAVWYAMLVYAPRQVAEREGSAASWLVRYGLFAGGTLLGLAGVNVLGS